jgi:pyridoxine 4-dehydrogenase
MNTSMASAAGTLTLGGDLVVNRLGFGAMRITGPGVWGEPRRPREAEALLRRALELGVNFIDTADSYGPEVSEQLIAAALHPYPAGLVIATKGGLLRPGPSQWTVDARPEHLRAACEGSLRRLKLACIDLYQLHHPDSRVPLEDSLGELRRLQQEGKIRHVGVSNCSVAQLQQARRVLQIVSVQNRYNIGERSSQDVLDECTRSGIAFIPWAPLGGSAVRAVERIAAAHGAQVNQLTIAWLLAKSKSMLPIPGTSSVAHLQENVAAAALQLTAAELGALG